MDEAVPGRHDLGPRREFFQTSGVDQDDVRLKCSARVRGTRQTSAPVFASSAVRNDSRSLSCRTIDAAVVRRPATTPVPKSR